MNEATDDVDAGQPGSGFDRRVFLRRVGVGAAVAGAWVAPQVINATPAWAGCTPITKFLQINGCANTESSTTNTPNPPGCLPTGWVVGRTDGVDYTYTPGPGVGCRGGVVAITEVGCTPVEAIAVRFCASGSGSGLTCVAGTIVGNNVTFPTTTLSPLCLYTIYRIRVTCCT